MGNRPRQDKRQTQRFRKVLMQCKVCQRKVGGNAGLEATQGKKRQGNARRGECKGVTLYGTRACQERMDTPGVASCML